MRLHQLADEDGCPILVEHPDVGTLILLGDCQVLDLNWRSCRAMCYDDRWIESKRFKFELENGYPHVFQV